MSDLSAAKSGTFKIGGNAEVHRLGYGAIRITGRGIWGEPTRTSEAAEIASVERHALSGNLAARDLQRAASSSTADNWGDTDDDVTKVTRALARLREALATNANRR